MTLELLNEQITACVKCKRLVRCRERATREVPKRFEGQTYWGKAITGFGDPEARIAIVGLAPAAHGANRTGRVFTGDRSGDWLYAALHRAGLANQPTSTGVNDGLQLTNAWVTNVVRCAPPDNKPKPAERDRCLKYLRTELALLPNLKVLVAMGGFAWDGVLAVSDDVPKPKPVFTHLAETIVDGRHLIGSYHVSQQNTFTGRLTEAMLDAVFARATSVALS
jgi:uracil-DNA glycosylase family 4